MSGRRSMRPDGSPAGSCGTSVTSSIDAPRATSGVNTARGERPVSVASAASSWPIACFVRAMSATTAERSASAVRKSYSPMMPPSKRSRCSCTVSVRSLSVSWSTTELGVGRAQPEVRARDVAGDRDAHGLAVVPRRASGRWWRRAGPRGTCPTRRARRTPGSRARSRCWSARRPTAAAATCSPRCASGSPLPMRSIARDTDTIARAAPASARPRCARARCAESRLLANASSTSAVSTGSLNAVHQCSRSSFCAAVAVPGGRSSLGGDRLRDGAAGERRRRRLRQADASSHRSVSGARRAADARAWLVARGACASSSAWCCDLGQELVLACASRAGGDR